MNKFVRKNIAKSLIFSQLLLNNSCIANTNTPKTWQEKSVEKLQSFAKEIKSSMKADTGWWTVGTTGLVTLIVSPFVVNHFRQMPKSFKQELNSIRNYHKQYQEEKTGRNSAAALDKILTFEKLEATVEVVCKNYESDKLVLPTIGDANVRLYYDFCVGADCHLTELLKITDELLQNSERKLIFIGGIYPNHDTKLADLLSVYLMCLLRLNFPDRVFIVSHKSGTEETEILTKADKNVEKIKTKFNSVFAENTNLEEVLLRNTPELDYLPDDNFMADLSNQDNRKKQDLEERLNKIYNNLGESSYIPEKSLKYALDTASNLMERGKTIIDLSAEKTVFVASDIHGDYSCLKFVVDKFLSSDNSKLVFLGDYIHRGKSDLQVLYLLCMLKICYPGRVYLLRGNHDERNTSVFEQTGFDSEISKIYSETSGIQDSLDKLSKSMSLAAIVNEKFYCVHGGINPHISLTRLRSIDRRLPWHSAAMADEGKRNYVNELPYSDEFAIYSALWGTPTGGLYYRPNGYGYKPNYTQTCVNEFLRGSGLKCLVHGHTHENKMDFNEQNSVSVRTNPMNWHNPVNNKSIGLVEIKNNHLTLQEYKYPDFGPLESKIVDKSY